MKSCRLVSLSLVSFLGMLVSVASAGKHAQATDWSARARAVAARRLAHPGLTGRASEKHVGQAQGPGVVQESGLVESKAHTGSLGLPDASQTFEISVARVVADAPEAQKNAESQPAEAKGTPVERGPLPTLGETIERDIKEAPGLLWHDTKKVFLNPCNLVILVGAGGVSLAMRPEVDDDIEDHYNPSPGRYKHTLPKGWRNFFDAAGNPGTAFAIAGVWYFGGQLLQDAKTYEVGKRTASALIINDLTTLLLKLAAADTKAPNGLRYAWPSGHMSSTVCLATCMYEAYGPLVGVPMYAFSVFEGIERLDDREHKFSDVVFGAALGFVVAETVMKEHRPEIFGGEIVPYVNPESGNAGVAWIKTLGN